MSLPDTTERYLQTLESMHPDDVMQQRIDHIRAEALKEAADEADAIAAGQNLSAPVRAATVAVTRWLRARADQIRSEVEG